MKCTAFPLSYTQLVPVNVEIFDKYFIQKKRVTTIHSETSITRIDERIDIASWLEIHFTSMSLQFQLLERTIRMPEYLRILLFKSYLEIHTLVTYNCFIQNLFLDYSQFKNKKV